MKFTPIGESLSGFLFIYRTTKQLRVGTNRRLLLLLLCIKIMKLVCIIQNRYNTIDNNEK